jgi:hypothetical protein
MCLSWGLALVLMPENGNPHKQLAVLATYVKAESVAVYRYCRSLLIAEPFTTAEENLVLLFERSRQRPLAPPCAPPTGSASSNSKEKSAFLKSFLHRLTRLHGILFTLASGNPTIGGAGATGAVAPPQQQNTPYSIEMERILGKDLMALLSAGIMGDVLLLKLMVTNIFCVPRLAAAVASGGSKEATARASEGLVHDIRLGCTLHSTNSPTFANYATVFCANIVQNVCESHRRYALRLDQQMSTLQIQQQEGADE